MKISRPSPSLAVSIAALVVASAGTATAASVIITNSSQVKANSLNATDIQNGSLTGIDIKNGSIKAGDLAGGVLTGTKVKGNSVTGQSVGSGAVTAQEAVRRAGPESQPANQSVRIGAIQKLVPGTYLVLAKTTITAATGDLGLGELLRENKTGSAECVLDIGGDQDHARQAVITPGSIAPATLNAQMTRTIAVPTDAFFSCSVNDFKWRASDTSIVALRLQGSTRVDTTG